MLPRQHICFSIQHSPCDALIPSRMMDWLIEKYDASVATDLIQ